MRKAANPLLSKGNDSGGKSTANTGFGNHRPPRLGQKLVHNGKFSRSSKRNPCPICTRNKDDKCAFKSDTIHCYDGVTNYPPRNLKLGQIIQINYGSTRDWALVKKNAGFSGNHCIFIPNKPLDKTKPLIKKKVKKVSIPKINRLFVFVSEKLDEALKPELSFLNLQQLEAVSVITDEAIAETKYILVLSKQFSQQELINDIQLTNLFETTKAYFHQLTNRAEQIKQWRAVNLGEEAFRDNI